jgi:hypothetical protein
MDSGGLEIERDHRDGGHQGLDVALPERAPLLRPGVEHAGHSFRGRDAGHDERSPRRSGEAIGRTLVPFPLDENAGVDQSGHSMICIGG